HCWTDLVTAGVCTGGVRDGLGDAAHLLHVCVAAARAGMAPSLSAALAVAASDRIGGVGWDARDGAEPLARRPTRRRSHRVRTFPPSSSVDDFGRGPGFARGCVLLVVWVAHLGGRISPHAETSAGEDVGAGTAAESPHPGVDRTLASGADDHAGAVRFGQHP